MAAEMANMKWVSVDDIMVVVHSTRPPTREEWEAFLEGCRELGRGRGMRGLLALSNYGLDAVQRAEASQVLKECRTRLACIITSSALTRGVVTALGWVTGINRAYSPKQLHDALDALALSGSVRKEVEASCRSLCYDVGELESFFGAGKAQAG